MRWHAADGRVLEGWVGGDPDGPLVTVLHGCPDTRHVAMTGDAAARAVGVRLLCVNRPGYGRSTVHASTHGSVADDLAGVATELGHERFAVLGMSVGGGVRRRDRRAAPRPGHRTGPGGDPAAGDAPEPVEALVAELAPEFLQWRAGVDPDDTDDEALAARWLTMLPPEDADLVRALGPAEVAASVREALAEPDGYLRDAALLHRPWQHAPAEVRCPVRPGSASDDRSGADAAADLVAGFGEVEVVVRPRTTHLATLVAHWPDILRTLRALS